MQLVDSSSHRSIPSAFRPRLLQLLHSADTDGFTVYIQPTQAENSTWHSPGAGLETGEMEHSGSDRQLHNLIHDTVESRKAVAEKLTAGRLSGIFEPAEQSGFWVGYVGMQNHLPRLAAGFVTQLWALNKYSEVMARQKLHTNYKYSNFNNIFKKKTKQTLFSVFTSNGFAHFYLSQSGQLA